MVPYEASACPCGDEDVVLRESYRPKTREHNGCDAFDVMDQGETMIVDEGNESSDAYCSSDDEDLSYVDFHTKVGDNEKTAGTCSYIGDQHLVADISGPDSGLRGGYLDNHRCSSITSGFVSHVPGKQFILDFKISTLSDHSSMNYGHQKEPEKVVSSIATSSSHKVGISLNTAKIKKKPSKLDGFRDKKLMTLSSSYIQQNGSTHAFMSVTIQDKGRNCAYTYFVRNGRQSFAVGLHFPTGVVIRVPTQGESSSRITISNKEQPQVYSSTDKFLTDEVETLHDFRPTKRKQPRINTFWANRMRRSSGLCNQQNARTQTFRPTHVDTQGVSSMYVDIGDSLWSCNHCGARLWDGERLKGYANTRSPRYNKCCGAGKVVLHQQRYPPYYMKELLKDRRFLDNIRAYNQMFAMTYFGAHVDELVNNRTGPHVFKISVQIYHWIRAMCPSQAMLLGFCKSIYTTQSMSLHQSYMSLQFPLLFVYGEPGYYPDMRQSRSDEKRLSMTAYYMYKLHDRFSIYGLRLRCRRLFQQYLVGVYCRIEQNQIDYYRIHQNDTRKDYLSGVHDAIHKGGRVGSDI
nr:helitron helicase-like domain-containing protein [Tanacetum cinerariifolium]